MSNKVKQYIDDGMPINSVPKFGSVVCPKELLPKKNKMNDKLKVSYTQFKQWRICPWRWKLNYIDKLREFDQNIYTIFGSAIHHVIQEYLRTLFNETIAIADEMDLNLMLQEKLKELFLEAKKEMGKEICTLNDITEFYLDGVEILDFLKKKRADYFSKKGYELAGIELKLEKSMGKNIEFIGYIDLIIKDVIHNKIKIYDLKTSTRGWSAYQKKDKFSTDQLLLYKKIYSEKYGYPLDKIDIEFFILKRKLYENCDFPQRRVQKVVPASGSVSMNRLVTEFEKFISECFTDTGKYNLSNTYEKLSTPNNCRFCEFRTDKSLCDKGI